MTTFLTVLGGLSLGVMMAVLIIGIISRCLGNHDSDDK